MDFVIFGDLTQAAISAYSVLPQADFFHLRFQACLQPIHNTRVTFWTVRFPNVCAAGMNTQGNLLSSTLCLPNGLYTVHCPSSVPVTILWCQEHFSITASLRLLTPQFQEHFLLVALFNRTPTFNFYTLSSCTEVPVLCKKGVYANISKH